MQETLNPQSIIQETQKPQRSSELKYNIKSAIGYIVNAYGHFFGG